MAYCVEVSSGTVTLSASQPPAVAIQNCTAVVFTGSEASYLMPAAQPFDATVAAGYWSFAAAFVVGVWFVAKNFGAVLSAIRRF